MHRLRERLVVLFLAGALLLNYPLLSLFAVEQRLFGVPTLMIYLFSVWAGVIFLTWLLLRRPRENGDREPDDAA